MSFVCSQFKCQTVLFGTLPGASSPSQSGPGSNSNEGVIHIPQNSSITGASPSDCLVSYQGEFAKSVRGRGSYPPLAKMQSMYSTPPADLAESILNYNLLSILV